MHLQAIIGDHRAEEKDSTRVSSALLLCILAVPETVVLIPELKWNNIALECHLLNAECVQQFWPI